MTGTNDDFDLPRWSTQLPHDALSSSAQAAQSAAQASGYIPFAQAQNQLPPPQSGASGNRLPASIHQSPNSNRQPRVNQLLDEDQQYSLPYMSTGNSQLARSSSYSGGASGTAGSRARRHHMQDDLEGAFNVDMVASQRHTPNSIPQPSLYPSSVAYHQPTGNGSNVNSASVNAPDPYQDAYFAGPPTAHPPKRAHTQHDPSTSSRAARSPLRATTQTQPLLDPYAPQQYGSNSNPSYPYSPTTSEQQRPFPAPTYQTHSRGGSQAKNETVTPPMSTAYSQQSGVYSPPYPMETTSPAPPSTAHSLSARGSRRPSVSQPATPLSYGHHSQQPSPVHFFGQDHQPMAVEPPPKRRASGLRRVRDQRDLRPVVNAQPAGRRMDANGVYLSVCLKFWCADFGHASHGRIILIYVIFLAC